MKPDLQQMKLSNVGIALMVLCLAAGAAVTKALDRPEPLFAGILAGLYLLFSIRVADQWEKAVVLRFGRLPDCVARECSPSCR